MKRALTRLLPILAIGVLLSSCGSSSSNSGGTATGLTFRAVVSQDISAGNVIAGLDVINALEDTEPVTSPITAGAAPGMLVLTPNRTLTLAVNPPIATTPASIAVTNNATESNSSTINLPGATESVVVSPDSTTAYVAVPTAPINQQNPGAIEVLNLANGSIAAEIPVPAVRYVFLSNSGNRLLAFSDNSNSVVVVTPSNIGTQNPVVSPPIPGFDHPVWAAFATGDNTAYVVNCGAQCNGAQASVQTLDLTSNIPGTPVAVPAAETALLNGTTLYLAGTPVPSSPCTGQKTQVTSCGLLTVFDLTSMGIVNTAPIIITDGYHNRMALGPNGQLFLGGFNCSEVIPPVPAPPGAEVRGCLSIYNTSSGAVVIPPASGDVTGLQPISRRTVVYVIQGGELDIYDTTTDALQATQINIIGEAVDVKQIDF